MTSRALSFQRYEPANLASVQLEALEQVSIKKESLTLGGAISCSSDDHGAGEPSVRATESGVSAVPQTAKLQRVDTPQGSKVLLVRDT